MSRSIFHPTCFVALLASLALGCGRDVPTPSLTWDLGEPKQGDLATRDVSVNLDLAEAADAEPNDLSDGADSNYSCASGALTPSTSLDSEGKVWTRVFEPFTAGVITYQLQLDIKQRTEEPFLWRYRVHQRFCVESSEDHYIWTSIFSELDYPERPEEHYIYRGILSLVDDAQHEYVMDCAIVPVNHTFEFNPSTEKNESYAAKLPLNI